MKQILFKSIFVLCFLCTSLSAQISIDENLFQPAPGTVITYPNDIFMTADFFNSLLAGTGGSMNWDFSARGYDGGNIFISVDPASSPRNDSFPDGNLCMMSIVGSDSAWQYYNSTPSVYNYEGLCYHSGSSGESVQSFNNMTPQWTFPVNYNDQWTSHRHSSVYSTNSYSIMFDTSDFHANAYGTVQYNSNSFNCLRIVEDRRATTNTYDNNDSLISSFTLVTTIIYFIGESNTYYASATRTSAFGILSYNSQVASDFINVQTGIEPIANGTLPDDFSLSQNYPNPFNPSTSIQLSLPAKSDVRLTVYDILGREVSILVDKELSAGSYSVVWDGKDKTGTAVASGVYLYSLVTDKYSESRKMILLK
ncbi:MAG: T9SS C-terminal target domain-containing protein [Calditrichaeota bacterium]|nr:MAG: T9SS C-terminal target domain-containing protein [Calditrichota bacterium]